MVTFLSAMLAYLRAFVVTRHTQALEAVALFGSSSRFISAGNRAPSCISPIGCSGSYFARSGRTGPKLSF
jgi:hypothetical protein